MESLLNRDRRAQIAYFRPTARYLMETEAHVYALAIAASVLLSFFPFCNVMLSFCRNILHWRAAEKPYTSRSTTISPGEMAGFLNAIS